MRDLTPYTLVSETALEQEARFVAQLAATLGAAEVSSTPPDQKFGEDDIRRFVRTARYFLSEARRQVNHAAGVGQVPVYDLDNLPPDLGVGPD